jgi:hypothetical protein
MDSGCATRFPVRPRQLGGRFETRRDRVDARRQHEDSGFGRHELGRAAHSGRDDGALARHGLEQSLTERLDRARLAEHVAGGDPLCDVSVWDAADESNARHFLELSPERAVADERQLAAG